MTENVLVNVFKNKRLFLKSEKKVSYSFEIMSVVFNALFITMVQIMKIADKVIFVYGMGNIRHVFEFARSHSAEADNESP